MIKKDVIEKILENCDIVDLIGSYLPLKKVGRYYRALCPFHHDTKPSFYVNPSQQLFHCFGCKESGNIIHFIMKYEKIEFPDAVRFLAEKLGITFVEEKEEKENREIYEVLKFASNFYHEKLFLYPQALSYLTEKRKLSLQTIKEFQLGFAPRGNFLINALKKRGYSEELIMGSGLAYKREGEIREWFFNRVIFPIFNRRGDVIGFGGRILDDETELKYLNSEETTIFKKGENLYGLYQTMNFLTRNKPVLVEGYFDLLALFDKGIKNLVAPLGTGFTINQARLLKKYSDEIIILFDGDNAGREATKRAIEIALKAGINPLVALLPDNYDPDKYLNEKGADELIKKIINQPYDLVDFYIKISSPTIISEKRKVLKELLEIINFTCDLPLKELYLNKISEIFNINKEKLKEKDFSGSKEIASEIASRNLSNLENKIINVLLNYPQYLSIMEEHSEEIFSEGIREVVKIIKDYKDRKKINVGLILEKIKNEEFKKKLALLSFSPQESMIKIKEEDFKRLLSMYLHNYYYNKYMTGEADNKIIVKFQETKKNSLIKKKLKEGNE